MAKKEKVLLNYVAIKEGGFFTKMTVEKPFVAESSDSKVLAKRVPILLGIHTMIKVYRVEDDGTRTYVSTLYPSYKINYTKGGKSLSIYAKPNFSYDERVTLEDTIPLGAR